MNVTPLAQKIPSLISLATFAGSGTVSLVSCSDYYTHVLNTPQSWVAIDDARSRRWNEVETGGTQKRATGGEAWIPRYLTVG